MSRRRVPATTLPGGTRIVWVRAVVAAVIGALATAVLVGVPTDVIPNGLFGRMEPVQGYAVAVLVATSVLSGLLVATWLGIEASTCRARGGGTAGTTGALLAWLAIGCPVCNKLVLLALGTSGALTWFAPLQPWLAAASLALLAATLAWRIRMIAAPARAGRTALQAPGA